MHCDVASGGLFSASSTPTVCARLALSRFLTLAFADLTTSLYEERLGGASMADREHQHQHQADSSEEAGGDGDAHARAHAAELGET